MIETYPRAWIEVGSRVVPYQYLLSALVDNTLYMAADSAELEFSNDRLLSDYFRKLQEVKVWMGHVTNPDRWSRDELAHVFTGQVDGVLPRFANGMTCRLMCRDYSAQLIDSQFTGSVQNVTTSELATLLFQRRGLNPIVTPTDTPVPEELVHDQKEWSVLQRMAERDGFVCYVDKDRNGYYGPRKAEDEAPIATIRYGTEGANITADGIEFDDSKVDVPNRVIVRHYLGRTKGYVEAVAEDTDLINRYGVIQRIIHDPLATDQATAQRIADNKLRLYKRGAVTANGTVIGNPLMRAEAKVQAEGFGRFSGPYYLDRVRHRFNKGEGYVCQLTMVNLRPENQFQYRDDLTQDTGRTTTP